jgi:tRNA modification GTPase
LVCDPALALMTASDTIVAIATASGRGGIGVVRISGPDIAPYISGLIGKSLQPRYASHVRFLDEEGAILDDGVALYFQAPNSFTGEHVLELQGHGGAQVLQLVLERCLRLGARLAEPGEFSRRAFINGKLDLAQAEAIADLIDAGSREAARSAVRTLDGAFSRKIDHLRDGLIHLRMLVEATLDFPEEDIDFLEQADVMAQAHQGALLREGLNVVLIGQPNVGKSSLMNQLAGYDAAIVTEYAGTTRDTLREAIQIEGVPIHLMDTAGLRDTEDPVERLGIARTWAVLKKSDIAVLLIDAKHGIGEKEEKIIAELPDIPLLTVHNKIDLAGEDPKTSKHGMEIWISAKTGAGIPALRHRLLELSGWRSQGEGAFIARARHMDALRRARVHLESATQAGRQLEFFAEELRLAQEAVSEITGEFSSDDLLGVIFSQFCIGK